MTESKNHLELQCVFSGPVQGVGFRATTYSIAFKQGITGFVRNLRDGTVELRAQGNQKQLETLLVEIKREYPQAHAASTLYTTFTERFQSFKIC